MKSETRASVRKGYAMRCKCVLKTVVGLLGLVAAATGLWAQTAQVTAIRAGRLFDSNSGQESIRQVVIVQGERILEVGHEDQVKIPQGARVIDLSQATVLTTSSDASVTCA